MQRRHAIGALSLAILASTLMVGTEQSYAQTSDGGISSFVLKVDEEQYVIRYKIGGGATFQSATVNTDTKSIDIFLDTSRGPGEFQIELPRKVIDAKDENNNDVDYVVLVDGSPANVVELENTDTARTLSILYDGGSRQITISGTHMIPELGAAVAMIVVAIGITSVVLFARAFSRMRLNFDKSV